MSFAASAARNAVGKIKPYKDIPGPPLRSGWPLLGHLNLYLKKPNGYGKAWKNVLQLKNTFLNSNDKIMKLNLPLFNWKHDGRVVVIFDDKDIGWCHLRLKLTKKSKVLQKRS